MPSRPTAAESTKARSSALVVAIACLGQFMVILDISVVNVALPSIHRDLHFSPSALQWVVNAYTLSFAGFLLLGGRAGDLIGRRRIFLIGLTAFSLASLLCGVAPNEGVLVVARAVQGLGAAVLAPASLAIISSSVQEPRARARAMGFWSASSAAGGSVGVLLGGILTQMLSWRWIFFINVPIGILAVVIARLVIPESRGDGARLDVTGSVLVTSALTLFVYGIVETPNLGWTSPETIALLAVGVALLVAFVVYEGRFAKAPIMPLRLFRSRAVSGANLVMFAAASVLFSMWFILTLYLQVIRGFSPIRAGSVFLVPTVGIIAGSLSAPKLLQRVQLRRLLAFGTILVVIGFLLFSRLGPESNLVVTVLLPGLFVGVGTGLSVTPITVAATSSVARSEAGIASGLVVTARQFGGSIGLAALFTVAASRTSALRAGGEHVAQATAAGYALAFRVSAVIAVLTLLAVLVIPGRPRTVAAAVEERDAPPAAELLGADPEPANSWSTAISQD